MRSSNPTGRGFRSLPAYDHRNDPTIVLPRRASTRPRGGVRLAPHQYYVVVAAVIVTACATAFIIGAAIMSALQAEPEPAAIPELSFPPARGFPVPEPGMGSSSDAPVTVTDLPVATD